jgi:hypothetical protein
MNTQELFSVYAMDRRLIGLPGYDVERFPHLTCYTPLLKDREGLVAFASMQGEHMARQIAEQERYFGLVGVPFRWRIFDGEDSEGLIDTLASAGFRSVTSSVLMAHTFDAPYPEPTLPAGLRIEHATTIDQLREALQVYSVAFSRNHSHLLPAFSQQLKIAPDTLSVFCVYAGTQPVAAAWTEFPRGSQFPELHPEAMLPRWSSPEVAQALLLARLHEAHGRMYNYAMAVVLPNAVEQAQSSGFFKLSTRVTLRSPAPDPWAVAQRRRWDEIEALRRTHDAAFQAAQAKAHATAA